MHSVATLQPSVVLSFCSTRFARLSRVDFQDYCDMVHTSVPMHARRSFAARFLYALSLSLLTNSTESKRARSGEEKHEISRISSSRLATPPRRERRSFFYSRCRASRNRSKQRDGQLFRLETQQLFTEEHTKETSTQETIDPH